MDFMATAQQSRLLRILQSHEEIRIGSERDCPLPLNQLIRLTDDHPTVIKVYRNGSATEVLHLKIDSHYWSVKRFRRDKERSDLAGMTAFMNELERRREIEALRELYPTSLSHVICTCFGSARAGIIISPWLRGSPLQQLNERNLAQILAIEGELSHWGWFDWDPSPHHFIDDGVHLNVFNFNAVLPFDTRYEFNPSGLVKPQFHVPERIETCTLSGLWLDDEHNALPQYRYWREQCIKWLKKELSHLHREGANPAILARHYGLLNEWEMALVSDCTLQAHWWRTMFYCHYVNVLDNVDNHNCSAMTLKRLEWLEQVATDQFAVIADVLTDQPLPLTQQGLFDTLGQWRHEVMLQI